MVFSPLFVETLLLGETVNRTRSSEVLHLDYLYVGDIGPLGTYGLDEVRVHLGHDR